MYRLCSCTLTHFFLPELVFINSKSSKNSKARDVHLARASTLLVRGIEKRGTLFKKELKQKVEKGLRNTRGRRLRGLSQRKIDAMIHWPTPPGWNIMLSCASGSETDEVWEIFPVLSLSLSSGSSEWIWSSHLKTLRNNLMKKIK